MNCGKLWKKAPKREHCDECKRRAPEPLFLRDVEETLPSFVRLGRTRAFVPSTGNRADNRSVDPTSRKGGEKWLTQGTHSAHFCDCLCAFGCCCDAFFEDVYGYVGFFFCDHQGWTDADCAGAASQEEDAVLEGLFYNSIALGAGVFLGELVFHDIDADHESAAAHVAYQLQLLRPVGHTLQQVVADFGGVREQMFFLDYVEGRERGSNAYRIAAEGGGVPTGNPVHDFGAGHGNAERHAGSDAFGHADHVRLDAGVLDGKTLTGASNAATNFVDDQHGAVVLAT